MEGRYGVVRDENVSLRGYVINLQSKLMDHKIDCPPPPPNVNLNHHSGHAPMPMSHAMADAAPGGAIHMPAPGDPLAQVAQAVAQLGAESRFAAKEYRHDVASDDGRTVEDLRQLHMDRQPRVDGLPAAPM